MTSAVGAARDLAEQRRLADAGRREQADALAAPEREQRVEHAHAGRLRRADRRPRQRRRRRAIDRPRLAGERRAAVDRRADARRARGRAGRRRSGSTAASPVRHTAPAGATPASSPSGSSTACSPRNPTTSAGTRLATAAIDPHELAERDARDGRAHDETDDLVDRADRDLGDDLRASVGPAIEARLAVEPRGLDAPVVRVGDDPRRLALRVVDDLLGARARVELLAADDASGLHPHAGYQLSRNPKRGNSAGSWNDTISRDAAVRVRDDLDAVRAEHAAALDVRRRARSRRPRRRSAQDLPADRPGGADDGRSATSTCRRPTRARPVWPRACRRTLPTRSTSCSPSGFAAETKRETCATHVHAGRSTLSGMPRSLLSLALLAGCAGTYIYSFRVEARPDDTDLAAAVDVDAGDQAVHLALTNRTDQVMQVDWAAIALGGTEPAPDARRRLDRTRRDRARGSVPARAAPPRRRRARARQQELRAARAGHRAPRAQGLPLRPQRAREGAMRRLAGVLLAGCASHYAMPMTAGDVEGIDSGPALVAYLGQPDASPAVCDARATGPSVRITPAIRNALIDGLVDGSIEPSLWRRCVEVGLEGMSLADRRATFDAALRAYRDLLVDRDIGQDPARVARAAAIHRLYLERTPGTGASNDDVLRDLHGHAGVLAPVAWSFVVDLLAEAEVERGTWNGVPIDVAMMDALAAGGNELTLSRFARRLPDPALREQASRRIVRVRIVLSAFDEVRADAEAVEDRVMRDGANHVDATPFVRAWFDGRAATIRNVLVRQRVADQSAQLLGYAGDRPSLSVLPELSFRGTLWAELPSVSRPVTLCKPRALDPTPCFDVSAVTLDNPFAYLDRGGAFHFRDDVAEDDAIRLAASPDFTLPVRLGGVPAVTLHWGLTYARPDDLVFTGASSGGNGPDLEVRIDHPSRERYVYTVTSERGTYATVVERADLGSFVVASAGASGASGSDGSSGSSGSSGSECSSGGDGGNGGNGGDGGNGGNGGNVRVTIACGDGPCEIDALERSVVSLAGAGGSGGSGGAGGSGGSGGSGRSPSTHTDADGNTVTDDAGCSPGSSGSSGSRGADGSSGAAGRPGQVTYELH